MVGDHGELLVDRQFQIVLLANLMPPLGTAVLSPVLNSLVVPLGATQASIGLMMSAYTAPAIVMIPVAGLLADRFGRRPVLVGGLLVFGLAGTAIALVNTYRMALILRFFQGIGFAALTPIIITVIGDLYAGSEEATAQGLRFTSSGIAQTAFPLASGLLVVIAWEFPFVLYVFALPLAVLLIFRFEEPSTVGRSEEPNRPLEKQLADLWKLVSHRRGAAMAVARATPSIAWIGFLTYNSIVVADLIGGTSAQAGVLAGLGSLTYAIAASQAGRLTDAVGRDLVPLLTLNLLLAAGFVVVFLVSSFRAAAVGILFVGIGFGLLSSIYRSLITEMPPQALRGSWVSFTEAVGRVAITLTPVGMGAGVAIATPALGHPSAVRVVGLVTGVCVAVLGIGSVVMVSVSPTVSLTEQ
jgi:ACDE family multidrug resistance protein